MGTFFSGLSGGESAHAQVYNEHLETFKLAYAAFKRQKNMTRREDRFTAKKNAIDVIEFGARVRQESYWHQGPEVRTAVRVIERAMSEAREFLLPSLQ